ncbi:uroporphyrinogen-III synthase [Roseococcus sp. YIM B11640]|uniref:uroporphyrinogen-III synthase n=1 Tax=Roseococcus sp. YIM B11640 TaxID=3133973 RepID=UPI003C7C890F
MPEPRRPGVLITRPEPGAAETAARVEALGWRPILAPALVLAPLPGFRPVPAQALLLTSRAAARALAPWDVPVIAVGDATAEAARERGFVRVTAAEGDAAAMAELAARSLDPAAGPLLLAVGQGYSLELAAALRRRGFRVVRRLAYAAADAPGLPEEAARALRNREVSRALFFSPRSAACSLRALTAAGLEETTRGMEAIAISPRVAHALRPVPWKAIRIAPRPDQSHILELLGTP